MHTVRHERFFYGYEEIPLDPPWPKCCMYRMNRMPLKYFSKIRFRRGYEYEEIPDIFAWDINIIVSEKMKEMIQEIDEFEHQFFPAVFVDADDKTVLKGNYYYLYIRRVLEIEQAEIKTEKDLLVDRGVATVQSFAELRNIVEEIPIWQPIGVRNNFYINEKMLMKIKSEKLTGFEWYQEF